MGDKEQFLSPPVMPCLCTKPVHPVDLITGWSDSYGQRTRVVLTFLKPSISGFHIKGLQFPKPSEGFISVPRDRGIHNSGRGLEVCLLQDLVLGEEGLVCSKVYHSSAGAGVDVCVMFDVGFNRVNTIPSSALVFLASAGANGGAKEDGLVTD